MRKLLFLIRAFICLGAVDAHADTCTLTSRGGEECLQVEPYTKRNSEGNTEYHWRLHNRCDVEIRVSYFQRGYTLEMGEVVPPHGTAHATGGGFAVFDPAKEGYYDFRVKGCSPSKEQGNDKAASDAAAASRSTAATSQSCADAAGLCEKTCFHIFGPDGEQKPGAVQACDASCGNQLNQCMFEGKALPNASAAIDSGDATLHRETVASQSPPTEKVAKPPAQTPAEPPAVAQAEPPTPQQPQPAEELQACLAAVYADPSVISLRIGRNMNQDCRAGSYYEKWSSCTQITIPACIAAINSGAFRSRR
jgi:hypothetical protein